MTSHPKRCACAYNADYIRHRDKSQPSLNLYESAYTISLVQMAKEGVLAKDVRNVAIKSFPKESDAMQLSEEFKDVQLDSSVKSDDNTPTEQTQEGFASTMNDRNLPEADLQVNNNVKSMRQYQLDVFPSESSAETRLEQSAVLGNAPVEGEEGLYLSDSL